MADAELGHAYAYKASLIGAAHRFELTEQGLSWRTGRRNGTWAYADIAAVRLSYRPMGMQHRRFRTDIEHTDGSHITIMSTSKQTVALMQPQAGYAAFILQLLRRVRRFVWLADRRLRSSEQAAPLHIRDRAAGFAAVMAVHRTTSTEHLA